MGMACGGAQLEEESSGATLDARIDATGIHAIELGGVNLFEGVGGYYIIGTCSGADDPGQNVISKGGDGRTLHAPGQCPGAPYSIAVRGDNPMRVSITVGPLPVAYKSISVPLDPAKRLFDRLAISGDRYEVGCGASWQSRRGSSARFDTIPQPCHIPGFGPVGAARTQRNIGPGTWGEIAGPVARIRRTIVDTNANELIFYRHPGTHNVEIGFGAHRAGAVLHLEETITVVAAGSAPPSVGAPSDPPSAGFPSDRALRLLYAGLLARDVDPSGRATYRPSLVDTSAMSAVAQALLTSAEHAARRGAVSASRRVQQMYLGFFGRTIDPTGLATYLPMIDRGEELRVATALIASAEMAARLAGGGAIAVPTSPPNDAPPRTEPAPVQPPAAEPPRADAPPLLTALYEAILGRAPDPSGTASFAARTRDIPGTSQVAAELLGSPEFAARRARVGTGALLDGFYRGLLGRPADPSGRATFLPMIERGEYQRVIDGLLFSGEMAARYGG